jgi:adenylate cyclase
MAYEIERKFLVIHKKLPKNFTKVPKLKIQQGYLKAKLSVGIANNRGSIIVKVSSKQEFAFPVPLADVSSITEVLANKTKPNARIRIAKSNSNSKAYLTIKGKGTVTRVEHEYEIPIKVGKLLLAKCSYLLTKIRHFINHEKHLWELDKYTGKHKKFWSAEVELDTENEEFIKPEWVGPEVTHVAELTNQSLARKAKVPSKLLKKLWADYRSPDVNHKPVRADIQ